MLFLKERTHTTVSSYLTEDKNISTETLVWIMEIKELWRFLAVLRINRNFYGNKSSTLTLNKAVYINTIVH